MGGRKQAAGPKVAVRVLTYLSAAGRILGSTTSDEFSVVVLEQLLVEAHVLFLGQDGVVGLQAVLLEEGGIAASSAIEQCGAGDGTHPSPWMSSRGFSRQKSSKLPVEAIVCC